MKIVALVLLTCFCAPRFAYAQSELRVRELSAGAVTGQIASGVAGTAIGFVSGGLATRWVARKFGASEDGATTAGYVGAYTGAAALTAVGPTLIATNRRTHGQFAAGIGGAAAGGAVSYILVRLGKKGVFGERGVRAVLAGIVIASAPAVGATVGVNSTRRTR